MTTSDVSVIIPNYNHTRFLGDALRSVQSQTVRPLEVIVVDDGSTDGCHELVSSFGDGIRYVRQDNQGLAAARNTGIRSTRGSLIGLLDADDRWRPNFLQVMTTLTAREPTAAAWYCGAQAMDECGQLLPQRFGVPPVDPALIRHTLLRANFIIPSAVLLRRNLIMDAGLFDESLRSIEDLDLWLRLSHGSRIVGSHNCAVDYRIHGDSLSGDRARMQASLRRVVEKHFGGDTGPTENWTAEKKRAYGGFHRFVALTSVRSGQDWPAGAAALQAALHVDPELAEDLDLFYDLALGAQPTGYRGTGQHLDLEANGAGLERVLADLNADSRLRRTARVAERTTYKALGLVAYNTGHYQLCQRYFLKALQRHPIVWRDHLIVSDLVKSVIRRLWPAGKHVHSSGN